MANADDLKRDACAAIDAMAGDLVAVSHAIHATPELAFKEFEAARILTGRVEAAGLPLVTEAFGLPTAFASSFGQAGKPEVAILSEYDALPEIGHACGHNIIAATGLGAALALAKLGGGLPGRVRYLGTPAEEGGGGKELMARQGAFDGLDAAMMVHPAGHELAVMPSMCVSQVTVTYRGRSAHAAGLPHKGINALDALVTAYQAIAQLRQHIGGGERIHGVITRGGAAPNIVPDLTEAHFYVRAPKMDELAALKVRVEACFQAGALAAGATVELEWGAVEYLELKASKPITAAYEANAARLGRQVLAPAFQRFGAGASTDMGNVSHRVPSIHPMIACAPPEVLIHNAEFTRWASSERGDKACIDGAKALAMTAIDVMTDEALRAAAHADFAASAEDSARSVALAYHEHGATHAVGCGCC